MRSKIEAGREGNAVINHDDLVREEFARQADTFSASSAITDVGLTQRFVTGYGRSGFFTVGI
jgi:hypothetical protein